MTSDVADVGKINKVKHIYNNNQLNKQKKTTKRTHTAVATISTGKNQSDYHREYNGRGLKQNVLFNFVDWTLIIKNVATNAFFPYKYGGKRR